MKFKHIERDVDGRIFLDRYVEYLDKNFQNFPPGVKEFARADWKFMITDPRCFHDSWLEFFRITEMEDSAIEGNRRNLAIVARFLGAYHDSYFELSYSNVSHYRIEQTGGDNLFERGHGDLIVDEITQESDGRIRHCIEFERADMEIQCTDIKYHWIPKSRSA